MARKTLTDFEKIIGIPPRGGDTATGAVLTAVANVHTNLALREWLQLNGIPAKSINTSLDMSKVKAYCIPAYLAQWRKNVNPNFSLLHDAFDNMDEADGLAEAYGERSEEEHEASAALSPSTALSGAAALDALGTKLDQKIAAALDKVPEAVKTFMRTYKIEINFSDAEKAKIENWARTAAEAKFAELMPPKQIEILNPARGTTKSLGHQHFKFDLLLRSCQARDHRGNRLNIWLTGPTGSGKTSAAEAVAKALDLPFGADSSLDADYKVYGYRDANGNLVGTEFRRIFEHGGIYVADEIDNWHPSALVALNAPLANGWASFPDGIVKRHPDCIIIACANTWGHGATNDYVGRNKLDAASLSRFAPKIDWPYDEALERAIVTAQGDACGKLWCDLVQRTRKAAAQQGIKIILSPRDSIYGTSLLLSEFNWGEVVSMTIAAGLSNDQLRALGLDREIAYTRTAKDIFGHALRAELEAAL